MSSTADSGDDLYSVEGWVPFRNICFISPTLCVLGWATLFVFFLLDIAEWGVSPRTLMYMVGGMCLLSIINAFVVVLNSIVCPRRDRGAAVYQATHHEAYLRFSWGFFFTTLIFTVFLVIYYFLYDDHVYLAARNLQDNVASLALWRTINLLGAYSFKDTTDQYIALCFPEAVPKFSHSVHKGVAVSSAVEGSADF